jgi:hypothetical protein
MSGTDQSGYGTDPSQPSTPVNGQSISAYSSYPGSNSSIYSIPSANSSMYSIPYSAGYNPYPVSSSTTSMGTGYGPQNTTMDVAEGLNERSGGSQFEVYDKTLNVNQKHELTTEAATTGATALAVGIGGMAVGAAAGSIRSTKLDKNGNMVDADGNRTTKEHAVRTTNKSKGAVLGLLVGLGAGGAWSLFNRNS